jgi:hypothetical protein
MAPGLLNSRDENDEFPFRQAYVQPPRAALKYLRFGARACFKSPRVRSHVEQNLTELNRRGFPLAGKSDSPFVLDEEASTHGQAFVGRSAD